MPRLYLTNDSYPELRDVAPQWARTVTWWKAILRAFRYGRFWAFLASQAACLLALVVSASAIESALDLGSPLRPFVQGAAALAWLCAFAYLQVSWGGDLMRSHLRAVSEIARYACPSCGHSLVGHVEGEATKRGPGRIAGLTAGAEFISAPEAQSRGRMPQRLTGPANEATKGGENAAPIRCPECAALILRDMFEPPYRVPRQFRAFPPWRSA